MVDIRNIAARTIITHNKRDETIGWRQCTYIRVYNRLVMVSTAAAVEGETRVPGKTMSYCFAFPRLAPPRCVLCGRAGFTREKICTLICVIIITALS